MGRIHKCGKCELAEKTKVKGKNATKCSVNGEFTFKDKECFIPGLQALKIAKQMLQVVEDNL